jgi:hypothetical protein
MGSTAAAIASRRPAKWSARILVGVDDAEMAGADPEAGEAEVEAAAAGAAKVETRYAGVLVRASTTPRTCATKASSPAPSATSQMARMHSCCRACEMRSKAAACASASGTAPDAAAAPAPADGDGDDAPALKCALAAVVMRAKRVKWARSMHVRAATAKAAATRRVMPASVWVGPGEERARSGR